ncbi:amino acid ABC transporter permease [Bacillus sp. UNC438CL73TsuS30]|uniref:amino acid ABC transporter permease n=1 Tax=Bacillus sp. UNC438CL73TsuS30 TaxID=1340434 RepID=UPI00068F9E2E|nr:amino acid ABC transporter permease [Bacillus sp. UNC438CL73TsuS30]
MFEIFWSMFPEILSRILKGAIVTIEVTVFSSIGAIMVGLLLVFLHRSKLKPLSMFAKVYVEIIRGIPAMVILFIIYFGLPDLGVRLSPVISAVIGLSMNGGAYLSEVFRSTIDSVHKGQTEAAMAVGMTPAQNMRYIVLPQAAVIAIPNIGNYVISLFKDTAIVSTIAAPEIMLASTNLISQTFVAMPIYLLTAVVYFCMSYPMSLFVRRLEKRIGKGVQST